MKIVIDIPDEAYKLLKNKRVLDNIAESIIANGTPYEPRGEGKCVTCKYRACWVTEKPCRECSRSYANLYEEAEND